MPPKLRAFSLGGNPPYSMAEQGRMVCGTGIVKRLFTVIYAVCAYPVVNKASLHRKQALFALRRSLVFKSKKALCFFRIQELRILEFLLRQAAEPSESHYLC